MPRTQDAYSHLNAVITAAHEAKTEGERALCSLFRYQAEHKARMQPNFVELSQPREKE